MRLPWVEIRWYIYRYGVGWGRVGRLLESDHACDVPGLSVVISPTWLRLEEPPNEGGQSSLALPRLVVQRCKFDINMQVVGLAFL